MLRLNKVMIQNRKYYHTCPACRNNNFNAVFFLYFLDNQAGNKTMGVRGALNVPPDQVQLS